MVISVCDYFACRQARGRQGNITNLLPKMRSVMFRNEMNMNNWLFPGRQATNSSTSRKSRRTTDPTLVLLV